MPEKIQGIFSSYINIIIINYIYNIVLITVNNNNIIKNIMK